MLTELRPVSLSIPLIINIIAIGQCLLLGLLYSRKSRLSNRSNRILIILLMIFAFDLFHDLLVHSRLFYNFTFLLGFGSFFTYIKGPLIFFYCLFYLNSQRKFKAIDSLHLAPFFIKQIEALPTYFQSQSQKISFLDDYYLSLDMGETMSEGLVSLYSMLWHLQPLIYLIASVNLIFRVRSYQKGVKEAKSIRRLKYFILAYLVIWLINVVSYYLSGSIIGLHKFYWEFATSLNSIAILGLAYAGLREAPPYFIEAKKHNPKSFAKQNELAEKLNEELIDKKAYLNPDLSLPILAQQLSTTTNQLSETLNQQLNTNFIDLINKLRIEEAKNLISSKEFDKFTIEAIAEKSGFNSSTSFYRAFKKFTGRTPSQYKKEQ